MSGLRSRADSILVPPSEDVELGSMGKRNDDIEEEENAPMLDEPNKQEDKPHRGLRSQIIDGVCICLNIASTVILVFLNKW